MTDVTDEYFVEAIRGPSRRGRNHGALRGRRDHHRVPDAQAPQAVHQLRHQQRRPRALRLREPSRRDADADARPLAVGPGRLPAQPRVRHEREPLLRLALHLRLEAARARRAHPGRTPCGRSSTSCPRRRPSTCSGRPDEPVILAKYFSGQKKLCCWTGKVIESPTCPPAGGCATRVLVDDRRRRRCLRHLRRPAPDPVLRRPRRRPVAQGLRPHVPPGAGGQRVSPVGRCTNAAAARTAPRSFCPPCFCQRTEDGGQKNGGQKNGRRPWPCKPAKRRLTGTMSSVVEPHLNGLTFRKGRFGVQDEGDLTLLAARRWPPAVFRQRSRRWL